MLFYTPFVEKKSINELQRGIFSNKPIKKGKKITLSDIYFAFPLQINQSSSGTFNDNLRASKNYKADQPIKEKVTIKTSNLIREKLIKE